MRASSSTSTLTCQNSPSHSSPVTASGAYPVSSSTVDSAAWASSLAESLPLSLDPAIALLSHNPTERHRALYQSVLRSVDLALVELARLARSLELEQPSANRGL